MVVSSISTEYFVPRRLRANDLLKYTETWYSSKYYGYKDQVRRWFYDRMVLIMSIKYETQTTSSSRRHRGRDCNSPHSTETASQNILYDHLDKQVSGKKTTPYSFHLPSISLLLGVGKTFSLLRCMVRCGQIYYIMLCISLHRL